MEKADLYAPPIPGLRAFLRDRSPSEAAFVVVGAEFAAVPDLGELRLGLPSNQFALLSVQCIASFLFRLR